METKPLILAVVISCVIFIGWNFVGQRMGWIPKPAEQSAVTAPADKAAPGGQAAPEAAPAADPLAATRENAGDPAAVAAPAFVPPAGGRLVSVETPLYKAVLYSDGGILREFSLKNYRVSLRDDSPRVNLVSAAAAAQAPLGLLVNGLPTWTGVNWSIEGGDLNLDAGGTGSLRLQADVNGMRVIRELTFSGSSYAISEKTTVSSTGPAQAKIAYSFAAASLATDLKPGVFARVKYALLGGPEPVGAEDQYNPTRVAWYQNGKFSEESAGGDLAKGALLQGRVEWMAVMNNYFMGAVSMDQSAAYVKDSQDKGSNAKGQQLDQVFRVVIGKGAQNIGPNQDLVEECVYFIGPKESGQLAASPNDLIKAIDYGIFSIVARPLVYLLQFLYSYVHNYGAAIILMTVLIKLLFWPLSQKSYKSMQQMKQLQPHMAKIREKYAGDKESMNREIMQLYKTYKVNPAGGCLPILVQIPVFIGLYNALLNAIELRHAPFILHLPFTDKIWLADLASPDPYLITPLVMGATMFLQQKMTPSPGDPTQAKVMMFMPIVFTFLFLGFPSGLVVYWLVNNVISIGQQWWQLRRNA